MTDLVQCPGCQLYTSTPESHICIKYDGPPCSKCGAGTIFVSIAAPGTGSGTSCENGHFVGHVRELTVADVI